MLPINQTQTPSNHHGYTLFLSFYPSGFQSYRPYPPSPLTWSPCRHAWPLLMIHSPNHSQGCSSKISADVAPLHGIMQWLPVLMEENANILGRPDTFIYTSNLVACHHTPLLPLSSHTIALHLPQDICTGCFLFLGLSSHTTQGWPHFKLSEIHLPISSSGRSFLTPSLDHVISHHILWSWPVLLGICYT